MPLKPIYLFNGVGLFQKVYILRLGYFLQVNQYQYFVQISDAPLTKKVYIVILL